MFPKNDYPLVNLQRWFEFFILVVLFHANVFSQSQLLQNYSPLQNITDNNATLQTVQNAMGEYWKLQNVKDGVTVENGRETKVPGWKLYKRWEYYWDQRANPLTGEFPNTNSAIEFEKYKITQAGLKKSATFNESWSNLGTNSSTGGYAGIGRVNCIAFHPTDANTFWVGSPSGGIWKTTNGGTSWTVLNDNQTVLGVSDIAVPSDYAASNTLYIATGDRDGGSMWSLSGGQTADNNSVGILKTTNSGSTWSTTGLSYAQSNGKKVYRLLIDPTNTNILLASTTDGIYKTTDGGTNWVRKSLNKWIDMEFKPADHNTLYASSVGYSYVYTNRSTDNGETWTMSTVDTLGYRSELAVSANNSSIVYMLSSLSNGGLKGIYKSTNSGASFTRIDDSSKSMMGYYSNGSGTNTGQGTYDLAIACSPSDVNTLYIGGINTWKSINGGSTWTINNMWTTSTSYNTSSAPEVHADKHVLAFQDNTTLFEGNDGGIYKTINGGTSWSDLTNGMIISQIYRLGVSQTDANVVLTGLQDNGSKKYKGALNTWFDATGGDGMECIIDFNNATTYMYATYVNGKIYRSTNGFSTTATTTISANITGGQPAGAWVTPYIMDPTNSAILYAGYDSVWKSTDRGNTWTGISQELSNSTKLRSLAIAPSNTNILYAADKTNMWKTTDGGSTNWSSVTLPTTSNSVTYIAVKNTDANTLWITYGGYTDGAKVYESTDGGGTWTNISTSLPNLPVMCIVHYKDVTNRHVLFVGTDVGVYVKDGTNNWASYNTGLPNVVVTELEIFYDASTDKLRAATFGRGLWETAISSPLPVTLSAFTASAQENAVLLQWQTATETNNYGFEIERRTPSQTLPLVGGGLGGDQWTKIGFVEGNGTTNVSQGYSFADNNLTHGIYVYRLKQIDHDGAIEYSKEIEVEITVPKIFALEQNYPNPFNPSTVIGFMIQVSEFTTLKVYDVLGREASTLVNEYLESGVYYQRTFNAAKLASGIYFAKLQNGNKSQLKKMFLLK